MTHQRDGNEKRKSPRIDFHLSVKVKGSLELQKVKNFGLYGIFLETDDSFQVAPGDEISLWMHLPNEEDALELKGQVAHVSDTGVGVAFTEIPAHKAMAMEACFDVFKETLPLPEGKHKTAGK